MKNDYFEYVIRDSRILSIIDKTAVDSSFKSIVSSVKPFGIRGYLFNEPYRYPDSQLSDNPFPNSVKIYGVKGIKGGARRISGYVNSCIISSRKEEVSKYKIFFTTSYSTGAKIPPEIILAGPNEICTETFLLIGPFDSEDKQLNCKSYIETNFFRTLLYYGKGTMHVNKDVFGLIPLQDFSHPWTDEMLYEKYGLTEEEINFIESMIKPME